MEQYKSLVQELKQQVTGLEMDSDKTSLAMLQQVKLISIMAIVVMFVSRRFDFQSVLSMF